MPRAVWSNPATSWGKLDGSHRLCSPLCPVLSPALPAAWGQPVLQHRGSFSWGTPSAPDGPRCPITPGGDPASLWGRAGTRSDFLALRWGLNPWAQDRRTEQSREVTHTLANASQHRPSPGSLGLPSQTSYRGKAKHGQGGLAVPTSAAGRTTAAQGFGKAHREQAPFHPTARGKHQTRHENHREGEPPHSLLSLSWQDNLAQTHCPKSGSRLSSLPPGG